MKTIFIILGILFSTFFLITGTTSVNAISLPSGFDTFVSVSGGVYYAKDSQNKILVSSSTPDIVIKTALGKKGDVNIATGSYILSSSFSGFDLIANTHVKLAKDAIIVVPSGFAGHVFRFNAASSHNVLEGGIIQEASPVKNKWTGILMQSGASGVYFNLVENMVINNPYIALDFNAGAGQWINGNSFINIQVTNYVRGIEFDLPGDPSGRNIDGNTFRDSSFLSSPLTTYGVKGIPDYDNAFYNVQFLNLPPNAISATVDSTAINTVIIGSTMTSQGFVDNGQNTIVGAKVHLPGDTGAPTITVPSENSLLDTHTPIISGTTTPFATVNVYNNNVTPAVLVGSVISDSRGFWSITSLSLIDGPYRISAKIGTTGTASPLRHFTVETGVIGTVVSETYDNFGNGVFTAKDSQNNIIISGSTPDNVIKTALARGGDIYIGTGAYFLTNTFSGFDLVSNTHLKLSKTAYMVVPSGFAGHVFRFSSGVVLGVLEGGILEEASPIKRSWTGILMQGGSSGINLNRIENIVLYDSYIPVEFNGASGQSGINSNTFFNIQGYNFVRGIEFDYTGSGSGFNTNTFLDSPFQSGSMTAYGVKGIKNNDNSFYNVQFWDLPKAAISSTIDSTAVNTVIIGGIMTSQGFVDKGSGTTIVDRSHITSGALTSGTIYMQDKAVTDGFGTYSARQINAENVGPSSVLVGKNIDTIILHLKKTGAPTGTATIGVFNPDLSVKKTFATLIVSSLATTYTDYTFSLTSGQSYTIQSGDIIGIKYSSGDKLNFVQVTADRNNGFDGASSYYIYYATTWGTLTGYDLTMSLEHS